MFVCLTVYLDFESGIVVDTALGLQDGMSVFSYILHGIDNEKKAFMIAFL